MKVSVIIPVYNAEKYIHRCLNSVLSQTYKNLEICLVDDYSTDRTVEYIKDMMKKDERIKLELNTENLGCGLTRRKAISMGSGDVFSFIDSDDYMDPTMLEDMVDEMKSENADIVICGTYLHKNNKYTGQQLCMEKYITYKEELYRLYMEGLWIMQYNGNKIYKKHIIDSIEYADLRFCEDSLTTFLWLWNADKVVVLPKSYYHYWLHMDSNSNSKNDNTVKDFDTIRCVEKHFDFCLLLGFLDILPGLFKFCENHINRCIDTFSVDDDKYKYTIFVKNKMLNTLYKNGTKQ